MLPQDALTTEQVLLNPSAPRASTLERLPIQVRNLRARKPVWVLLLTLWLAACGGPQRAGLLTAPYDRRVTLAVAPLRNEAGSTAPDGLRMADRLTEQLTLTAGVDTVPVNRVLAAMEALGLPPGEPPAGPAQAAALRRALNVDGLVVGSVTAYDPYDPPRIGLNVDLYLGPPRSASTGGPDLRRLSRAATPRGVGAGSASDAPVNAFSALWDAAHPVTQDRLARYAAGRGTDYGATTTEARLHRISMDLYAAFVAYEAARRLMDAEALRLDAEVLPKTRPQTTDASFRAQPSRSAEPPTPR